MRHRPEQEADLLFYKASRLEEENKQLRDALQPFADCGHHLSNHKFVPSPTSGIWVPRTTNDPQPPCILVKHLLDAAKALPSGSVSAPVSDDQE